MSNYGKKRTILNCLFLFTSILFFVVAATCLLGFGWESDDLMRTLAVVFEGLGFVFLLLWIFRSIKYLYKEIEKLKKGN